MKKTLEDL
jgi:hypothetical protein